MAAEDPDAWQMGQSIPQVLDQATLEGRPVVPLQADLTVTDQDELPHNPSPYSPMRARKASTWRTTASMAASTSASWVLGERLSRMAPSRHRSGSPKATST